jgi:hypothetical protein
MLLCCIGFVSIPYKNCNKQAALLHFTIATYNRLNEVTLDKTEIEITSCHTFLGSIITSDGYNCKDINRRLSIGRMAMTKLEKIMKDRDVKKATKIKIAETVIFPTVMYGSESWTVRKRERKKTDAFELWTWKRILQVPWIENKPFSFGRSETQKITRSDNPSTRVMLFWSCHESKKITGMGHYAWSSGRTQEAGKTMDALA